MEGKRKEGLIESEEELVVGGTCNRFLFAHGNHVLGFLRGVIEGVSSALVLSGTQATGHLSPKGTKPAMERDVSLALALLGVLPPRVTVAARLIMFKKSHRVRNGAFSPPLVRSNCIMRGGAGICRSYCAHPTCLFAFPSMTLETVTSLGGKGEQIR
jgi:hypothetical protein